MLDILGLENEKLHKPLKERITNLVAPFDSMGTQCHSIWIRFGICEIHTSTTNSSCFVVPSEPILCCLFA